MIVRLQNLLNEIENNGDCKLYKTKTKVALTDNLIYPADLKFFLENYNGLEFFLDKPYGIKIVGISRFVNANKEFYPEDDVIWEELEGDISNEWYVVAENFETSQYITIDMNVDRLGICYDSFYEIHADPDFSPIIAKSFTDLLENLYESKGMSLYWNDSNFESLGSAYPDGGDL